MAQDGRFQVTLLGSVAFTLGSMIGAGIFVLVGPLAARVGPLLWLSFVIALVPAAANALGYAQLGSSMQVTSSTYAYTLTFFGSLPGFLAGWFGLLSGCASTALLGHGLAQYLQIFVPGVPALPTVVGSLLIFYVLHVAGLSPAEKAQKVLVFFLIGGLSLFVVSGLCALRTGCTVGSRPGVTWPVLEASVAAYFCYLGFSAVTEIGQEIRDGSRAIPLSILVSMAVVGFLYLGLSYVVPRVVAQHGVSANASLAEIAGLFLPRWGSCLVGVCGIVAILTSINSAYLFASRVWFVLGRDGWLPGYLTKANRRGAPVAALTVTLVGSQFIALFGWDMVDLGIVSSVIGLVFRTVVSWGAAMLPRRYPREYSSSPFRLSRGALIVLACLTTLSSCALLWSSGRSRVVWYSIGGWLVPGLLIYRWRVARAIIARKDEGRMAVG